MEYVANMSRLGYNVWTCSFRTNVYSNSPFTIPRTYLHIHRHAYAYTYIYVYVCILYRSFSLIHYGKIRKERSKCYWKKKTKIHSIYRLSNSFIRASVSSISFRFNGTTKERQRQTFFRLFTFSVDAFCAHARMFTRTILCTAVDHFAAPHHTA